MRVIRRTYPAGIAGCLFAIRSAGIASRLTALGLASCARSLTALRPAGIAGPLASRLIASRLTRFASGATHSPTGIGVADLDTSITHADGSPASVQCRAETVRTPSSTTAGLISDASERLSGALNPDCCWAIEECVGLRGTLPNAREPHVEIELVAGTGTRRARVLDHRVLSYADTGALEPLHRRLFRWDGLGKDDILLPEFCVIGEGSVEVESCPPFAIAFAGQTF